MQNYPFISCRWTQTEKEENDYCLEDITYTDQDGNTHCVEKDSDETVEVQCIADGGIRFDHFSLMSFILLLAEHFPYTPCNFTLDCQKMDEPCGGLMDVGCWCLFGQCVTGDEGERKECSKTEDCTKMDKCASGHCYCSESNRAGNELLLSFTISLIVYDIIHFKCTLEIVKDCEISIFAKVCFQLSI